MNQRRTGDLKLIQELNRSIVFDTIRKYGPISRSEIAKRNKISPTTVTSAVNELLKGGWVYEGEQGASSGGRKPILLHFSPDSHFIIGVSITNSSLFIGKLNIEAKLCEHRSYEVDGKKGAALIDDLLDQIESFLQAQSDLEKCIGISIVTPGIVDYESGVIRYNSKLMLIDVPLKEMVEKRLGVKTWLDNDTNAIALAEKEIGRYDDSENLLYIMIGEGVGAGIVLNGKVFRGNQGGAGEFGHTTVERGGIRCECGNKGCIENYVSWPALYSRIITSVTRKQQTEMIEMTSGNLDQITPEILLKASRNRDRLAVDILEDTASFLSTGIINIVNLFNPDLIILGGEVARNNDFLVSKVKEIVINQALKTNTDALEVDGSSLGEHFDLIAAANIVLHEQFAFSLSS